MRKGLIGFILVCTVNFVFSYFFYTPKVYQLNKSNYELLLRYELLKGRIRYASVRLSEIGKRDLDVYRSVFAVDSLDIPQIYHPYHEGKYNDLQGSRFTPVMQDTWMMLDAMSRQLYYHSVSMDALQLLAMDTEKMTEYIPAIWPVDKNLVRGQIGRFGYRIDPVYGHTAFHAGIDFAGNRGTNIYATGNGKVVNASIDRGYGKNVVIDHGYGYRTRYAHLDRIDAVLGQEIRRGEKIGLLGNTGKSIGPHLHYEVIYRGKPVNPINYFSRDMSDEDFKRIVEMASDITYESE